MGGQHHAPTAFPPVRRPSTDCQRGLVGPSPGLDGAENLSPTGIQLPERVLAILTTLSRPTFKKGQERDMEHGDIQAASKIFYELFRSNGEVCV